MLHKSFEPRIVANIDYPQHEWIHPSAEHEWWYANGHVSSPSGEKFSFMVTFLSQQIYLMIMDERNNACFARSLRTDSVRFSAPRNELSFGDSKWTIERTADGFVHRLEAECEDISIKVSWQQVTPPVNFGQLGLGLLGRVNYYALTDLACQGVLRIGNAEVEVVGTGWIDRMWGDWESAGFSHWEWLSIKLNDGTDAVYFAVFHPLSPQSATSATFVLIQSGKVLRKRVIVSHLKTWRSDQSGVKYMIGWKIVSKEDRDLNFLVVPKTDAQELRAYIWEGTCSVKGTIGGRPVEGEAYGGVLYNMTQDSVSLRECLLLIYYILGRFLARSASRHAALVLDKIMTRVIWRVKKCFSDLYTNMA